MERVLKEPFANAMSAAPSHAFRFARTCAVAPFVTFHLKASLKRLRIYGNGSLTWQRTLSASPRTRPTICGCFLVSCIACVSCARPSRRLVPAW